MERNDFFEEDESAEKIWASWVEGEKGLTRPPTTGDHTSPTTGNPLIGDYDASPTSGNPLLSVVIT